MSEEPKPGEEEELELERKAFFIDADALKRRGGLTCYTCRFYEAGDGESGECRRRAPGPVVAMDEKFLDWSEQGGLRFAYWVQPQDSDWCGEHQLRESFHFFVDQPRLLNLTWGDHLRDGEPHTEWFAPCGCAFHPEPTPHVHRCRAHAEPQPAGNGSA